MPQSEKVFHEFWREIKSDILREHFKVLIRLPLAIIGAIVVVRLLRCAGIGVDEELRQYECSIVLNPILLFESLMSFFPIMMKGIVAAMPFLFCAVLYLEWDRYKKDEASWFTHGKGCEGPPGYSRRLKLMQGTALSIGGKVYEAEVINENHRRYAGVFSEEELLRYVRRQYARSENKPLHDSPERLDWAIRQNNGTEVHIELRRLEKTPTQWVMVTRFYEWAGRRQPPRLAQTHTTEFVLQANGEAKPGI